MNHRGQGGSMSGWELTQTYPHAGGAVRYDVRGDGPPLVLVHGTPWSSFNWRHVIPALAGWFTVYTYDLIGYGASEKRAGQDVSLAAQNRLLADLLDHWQLDAPFVVGHDFGGTTVLRTHLLGGRDFAKIALVDPVALSPWGSPFFRHVNQHEAVFRDLPPDIHEAVVTAYVRGATHRPMPADTLAGIVAPWLGEAGQGGFYRQIAQADQAYTDEVEPLYGSIARPVLIVWGEQDVWIPVERGRELHAAVPGSEFVTVPAAGHLVQEDQPALLTSLLLKFFG
jgi:pimeloyl-ACP methyl ester carboxylesterase